MPRRSVTAVLSALLALAVLGTVAAQGAGIPNGRYELRPEAGKEVDRDVPGTKSKSNAPRIVPGKASAIASSNPGAFGFTGVTFKDHRDADNGNQTSDTPPDQGLCEGSGTVIEPVNTTFSIYSTSGQRTSGPTSLTEFFTGEHEIDRTRRSADVRAVPERPEVLLRPGGEAVRDDDPPAARSRRTASSSTAGRTC